MVEREPSGLHCASDVQRASIDWRRKHGVWDTEPKELAKGIPRLRLSAPAQETRQAHSVKKFASPRTLPLSRGLKSAAPYDSRRSARAVPTARTLLIWAGRNENDLMRRNVPGEPRTPRDFEPQSANFYAYDAFAHSGGQRDHGSGAPSTRHSLGSRGSRGFLTTRGSTFSRGSRGSLSTPAIFNGSPRIIEACTHALAAQQQTESPLSARPQTEASGESDLFTSTNESSRCQNLQLCEMLDLGYSQADLEKVAATKIQNMIRGVLGKAWLRREKMKGNLVSVPPDRRSLVRSRVQEVFSRELPSYTSEAWRFEMPWNPFILGAKFPLSQHKTLQDKPHPFVRMGQQFDFSHLPGALEGHEPLSSARVWVNRMYREQSTAVLADTMKSAFA